VHGLGLPFAGHKALGDWQAALGINLRCPHLAWYTMEAEAKRDYPAAISWQSPWWQAYPKVEDYFARINAATSRAPRFETCSSSTPSRARGSWCGRGGWTIRE